MNKIIEVENISFKYSDNYILSDLTFEVNEGDFAAIIGENGSGKSTLINILLSNLKVDSGSIRLFSDDINKNNHHKDIAYISQNSVMNYKNFPTTINEVIKNHIKYLKLKPNEDEYLKKVGLFEHRHKMLRELSGGQLQRLGVLIALIKDAKLILMDEPTTGIDKKFSKELFYMLKNFSKDNKTIVIVTHDLQEIRQVVDYVLHIQNRKIHKCMARDWEGILQES